MTGAVNGDSPSGGGPGSASGGVLSTTLEHTVVPALRRTLAVAPRFRPATSAAFHLGTYLGRNGGWRVGRLRTGSSILVDVAQWAHRRIYFYGTYEEGTTALLHRLAQPGWVFLDVGANAGYFSLLAADLGGPSSRIVAFEPNRQLADALRRSVALNDGSEPATVEVHESACSQAEGVATLVLSPDPRNSGLSSIAPSVTGQWTSETEAVEVPVVRLDEWCEAHACEPDVVKVDVEGHELAVVEGMTGLLRRGVPGALVCELTDDPVRAHATAVFELLSSFGYQAFGIEEGGALHAFDAPADVHGLQNVCFLSPLTAVDAWGDEPRAGGDR